MLEYPIQFFENVYKIGDFLLVIFDAGDRLVLFERNGSYCHAQTLAVLKYPDSFREGPALKCFVQIPYSN